MEAKGLNRRHFLGGTLAAAAFLARAQQPAARPDAAGTELVPFPQRQYERKLRIGLLGGGHRGNIVADNMLDHGGYEIASVCDYSPETVAEMGKKFNVAANRQFSGLNGYKRMIDAGGIDVLAILDVPYFYPEQVKAAVEAGLHVYIAKPIAIDVPGALSVGEQATAATRKGLCVRVDYQLPDDPANVETIQRMKAGALGALSYLVTVGNNLLFHDPAFKGDNIASRFWKGWMSDVSLGGDIPLFFDIHIIDGVWVAMGGKTPVQAMGKSNIRRKQRHGDRMDAGAVIYEFDDGTFWTHRTQSIQNNSEYLELEGLFFGTDAVARIGYYGKSYMRAGNKEDYYVKEISKTIYRDGIIRNVIGFYDDIENKRFANETVPRAVQGTLTAILGRDAAERGKVLTMDELIRENRKLTNNLNGLTT